MTTPKGALVTAETNLPPGAPPKAQDPVSWWPELVQIRHLGDILPLHAKLHPNRHLITARHDGNWQRFTAGQLHHDVQVLAAALASTGLQPADRVLVMSRTRYEWLVIDAALWTVGAISVPIAPAAHSEHLRWVLRDSGAVMAITDTPEPAQHLRALDPALQCYSIEAADQVPALNQLVAHTGGPGLEWQPTRGASGAQSPVTLAYSPGVTTRPRGAVLSHGNLLAAAFASAQALSAIAVDEQLSTLVYQSLTIVSARVAVLRALLFGTPLILSDPARVNADCEEQHPNIIVGAPQLLHRVYQAASHRANAAGKGKRFAAVVKSLSAHHDQESAIPPQTRNRPDNAIIGPLRATLGGKVQWYINCAAPCPAPLVRLFTNLGITVLDSYGLAETAGVATQTRPGNIRAGWQGAPVDGLEMRISDRGQIAFRGPNVFAGYFDEATTLRRSVAPDGWFTSLDVGELADEGLRYLRHRQNFILTSAGSLISPLALEENLRLHPLVSHAVVVGQGQASLGVLVSLDIDAAQIWLAEHDHRAVPEPQLATHPAIMSEIQIAIESLNDSVSIQEQIRRFWVVPAGFSHAAAQLNDTMRINRDVIVRDYADEIARMYGQPPFP